MKKLFFFSIAIAGICSLGSCHSNSGNNSTDAVDSAKQMNDSMSNNSTGMAVSETDSKFAVDAADGGMTEVEASKTAQQKAMNPRVKSFADMMVMDHSKANDELKATASTKSITLPAAISQDHQDAITKLSQKTGRDFDKAYMDMMVDDHKKVIDLFEKESNKGDDSTLKNWATNTLPTLRQHLDSAKAIRDMIKK